MKLKFNIGLVLVLALVLVLRLPSFWEPYWYGDEGIYLTVGQAMQRGAVLYRDIWDNKPPLLYLIYAISPTLLWAKVSATFFVLGTCFFVYRLSQSLFSNHQSFIPLLTTFICGVLLSLPLLEGTIANAELYFTLPIVWGAYLLYRLITNPLTKHYPLITALVGLLASAAFFLKVPAIFDFVGMFIAVLTYRYISTANGNHLLVKAKTLLSQVFSFWPMAAVFISTLLVTLAYFYLNHALGDFLIASFSQNAAYVEVDTGPLAKLSNPLFVKALILLISLILLTFLFVKKRITKELLFLTLWFSFSLYGALLSNRPYMHYLLQIVPPAVLLGVYLISCLRTYWPYSLIFAVILFALIRMFTGAFALDSRTYYKNWFNYISERKTWESYANYFDFRTLNSYKIANFLTSNTSPLTPTFVWGDASFIYVLSERPPATKFIQAHHLSTIDPKNYDQIIARLKKFQPKYILVSRPVHFEFPKLEELLQGNYKEIAIFEDLHVYENTLPVTPIPWTPNYTSDK